MSATVRLEPSIKECFAPILRADGFNGSGRTFRRVVGEFIHVVNIQGSRYGGQFAVNLAVQPLRIPDVRCAIPDPQKIAVELCEFQRRLADSGADQWWEHGNSRESMDSALRSAAAVYLSAGRGLFVNFFDSQSPLLTVTPEEFANGQYCFFGFGSTEVRMALALALLRQAYGDIEAARGFASYGLTKLKGASGLRGELESIRSLGLTSASS